ncbi:ParA family protein [Asticcacaulis sp. EMRT-3]|uniref:ParA family protein n=1 Tax=Asticcacaulis sp. EMRT-3 TaxID=3040349 RepID=UPI0024AF1EE9|nr:ParA family protein [Asticcacaulis sp. EMRT-3]MDI7776583.1 ParA family protein [Asticcacaulis sp. EMRT-3]
MKTLVLANQKGGVGKSAVATQFAQYLIEQGHRVLFIDLDHQRNSSKALAKSGRATIAPFTATKIFEGVGLTAPSATFALVEGDGDLSGMERQPTAHNAFVNALKAFLDRNAHAFDVCVLDTNPNPDIRYAAGLIVADYVLSPIQLNQEAIDGIGGLLNHTRYGIRKIKATLNPSLELIGILPNLVEPTPFQRGNLKQIAEGFGQLLIPTGEGSGIALLPRRSVFAEAQADGTYIANLKKTAARDTWREIRPVFEAIAHRMGLEVLNDA